VGYFEFHAGGLPANPAGWRHDQTEEKAQGGCGRLLRLRLVQPAFVAV